MSNSDDQGCCGCFGFGRKKKTQVASPTKGGPTTNRPEVRNPEPPVNNKKPDTDPPKKPVGQEPGVPDFVTQVGRPGQDGSLGKITIPGNSKKPDYNRDEIDINSPRGVVSSSSGGYKNGQENVPWRPDALLPPQRPDKEGRKCLILDLDETLVHSSFKEVPAYDFLIPIEIDGITYQVYVAKRPGVDEFMKKMGECYEICVFTASLAKYADPVLDLLDIHKVIDWRLFRESCTCIKNTYVKDMGRMGRPLKSVMIMDNSPHSYSFNPENAIPCESWFDDYTDVELLEFIPVLQAIADPSVDNVITELERLKINGVARLLESMESSSYQSESSVQTGSTTGSESS